MFSPFSSRTNTYFIWASVTQSFCLDIYSDTLILTVLLINVSEIYWFRNFEDIRRRCEPSNVVAYIFGPPCRRRRRPRGSPDPRKVLSQQTARMSINLWPHTRNETLPGDDGKITDGRHRAGYFWSDMQSRDLLSHLLSVSYLQTQYTCRVADRDVPGTTRY